MVVLHLGGQAESVIFANPTTNVMDVSPPLSDRLPAYQSLTGQSANRVAVVFTSFANSAVKTNRTWGFTTLELAILNVMSNPRVGNRLESILSHLSHGNKSDNQISVFSLVHMTSLLY